jgi:hypothetical protein
VRLQVRTCEEPTCDGRPFHGPDGTPESFFAPATYVFEPGPLAFPLSVMPGRYLQWRALLASELTTSGPVVASVAFLLE